MEFRNLIEDEIEVRAKQVGKGWARLLLYKDARVDMNLLDETVGASKWQRDHKELKGNIYCGIAIKEDAEWVWKWDCGAESLTEKEKGEASDSFKRAGTNWGIGRELYTAPKILANLKTKQDEKGKWLLDGEVTVEKIKTENKVIQGLALKQNGTRIFVWKREEN